MNKNELRNTSLSQIQLPCIGKNRMQVEPVPGQMQTRQLQQAIDDLSRQGGGTLVLQPGVYRTGALHLKNGVELHLASEDTLVQFVPDDPAENYPLVFSHWEASPCYNFSALLYACDAQDIAVTGKGVLDGGADADHWGNWHHQVETSWSENKPDLQLADRSALRSMNLGGVPVDRRIFGEGHYLRPNFFQSIRCQRVLLQGVTLRNSPMWQLNPVLCSSVVVDGVTLSSHGANNDGCDPESCNGVWIKNCRFDTGDDCISLKSGRDRDGREANVPCRNILIENNDFADGHGGVALGSEMSGGIYNVLASGNRFSSPNLTYALRLKTNARRGGAVERVMLCDSVMDHVHGAAVHGTMLYEDGRNGDSLPVFRDITMENITAHGGDYGVFLEAFPEVPITGLVMRNITIDGVRQCLRSMNWKLGGVLAVGCTVADLDLVQAVDHSQRGGHHKKHGGTKADMTQPGTEPCVRVRTAAAGTVLFGIGGWCLHCVLPKKTEKACAAARFSLFGLFCRSDRGKNGHCPIVEQIRPLPHSGCLAHQNAALIQPDVGDLALVDLHQPQAGGGLLNTCDVGAAVQA